MVALATLFIAFVTVGVVAANYFMQRSERRRNGLPYHYRGRVVPVSAALNRGGEVGRQ